MTGRAASLLLGPEAVLACITAAVLWFCARHDSGQGRDVELMERIVWLLPLIVVPAAFATVALPGTRDWWWLARTVLAVCVALCVCGNAAISGFGSGAKGQDGAMIIIFTFGLILVSCGVAACGAMILRGTHPGFAAWYAEWTLLARTLTLLAALPIGMVLGFVAVFVFGVYVELSTAFNR